GDSAAGGAGLGPVAQRCTYFGDDCRRTQFLGRRLELGAAGCCCFGIDSYGRLLSSLHMGIVCEEKVPDHSGRCSGSTDSSASWLWACRPDASSAFGRSKYRGWTDTRLGRRLALRLWSDIYPCGWGRSLTSSTLAWI